MGWPYVCTLQRLYTQRLYCVICLHAPCAPVFIACTSSAPKPELTLVVGEDKGKMKVVRYQTEFVNIMFSPLYFIKIKWGRWNRVGCVRTICEEFFLVHPLPNMTAGNLEAQNQRGTRATTTSCVWERIVGKPQGVTHWQALHKTWGLGICKRSNVMLSQSDKRGLHRQG